MSSIRIAISHGFRTSGGGAEVGSNLIDALRSTGRCEVTPFDPYGAAPADVDIVWCLGTKAVRVSGARTVFFPLSVAYLEPETVCISSNSPKAALRLRLLKPKVRRAIRNADALGFGSPYAARLHQAAFARAKRLQSRVFRNGLPSLGEFAAGDGSEVVPGRVLLVSHWYPYKRIVEAIRGFDAAARDLPGAELHIAGNAPDLRYARLVRQAAATATANVQLLGALERPALATAYRRADVVLLTSSSENAASFAAYDAFHFGKPLVSSRLSSLGEMLEGAAELVDPRDPGDIANGLRAVLGCEDRADELRRRARAFALEAPSWEQRAADMIEFCHEVASNPVTPP